jgi:hypothetical protein
LIAPFVAFIVKRGEKLTSDEFNSGMARLSASARNFSSVERQKAVAFLLPEQRGRLPVTLREN